MLKFKRSIALTAIAVASQLVVAAAAEETTSGNALRIGSGPDGKVYQVLVRDMQSVCGGEVPIANVPSIGGIPNLMKLSASEIDLGIAQLDTLRQMSDKGDDNLQTLQIVMPLHTNLLHILSLRKGSLVDETYMAGKALPFTGVTKVISKFSDLKGTKIAVVGSTMLLGESLNRQYGYGMDLRKAETDDDAVELLKQNKVQAIFTDGGWPLPSITRHKLDSGLQLVDFDLSANAPFLVVKRSYENLDAFKKSFLGSPNVLITRPFRPNGEMGRKVSALQSCLLKNLDNLQEGRFHAAWKEIKNPTEAFGIPRFAGVKAATR